MARTLRINRPVRLVVALLMITLIGLRTTPAGADSAEPGDTMARTQEVISPSVAFMTIDWDVSVLTDLGWYEYYDSELAFQCSGVIVSPDGYVATAAHCVDDGPVGIQRDAIDLAVTQFVDSGDYDLAVSQQLVPAALTRDELFDYAYANWTVEGEASGSEPGRTVAVELEPAAVGDEGGAVLPARVVDLVPSDQGDVALLKVNAADLTPAVVGSESTVEIGDAVLAVGYSGATDEITDITLDPSFKDGRVSAMRTREEGLFSVIEHSAPVLPGMSGGPLVDSDGAVVGITSLSATEGAEGFEFASPASIVTEMLGRAGASNDLPALDRTYRAGVDALHGGDPHAAVASFEQVIAQRPEHEQAQELLDTARDAAHAEGRADAERHDTGRRDTPAAVPDHGAPRRRDLTATIIVLVALAAGLGIAGTATALVVRQRQRRVTSAAEEPEAGAEPADGQAAGDGDHPRGQLTTVLLHPTITTRYCSRCGGGITAKDQYCASCGTRIAA